MDKLYAVVGALGMVLLPIGFAINLCYDLNHPELWCDWQHDPRLYGTFVILIVGPLLWLCFQKQWKLQRMKMQIGRLNSMLDVVGELAKSGWNQAAEEAYQLYHRAKAARSEAEEDKLTKQFLETFGL